MSEDLRQRVRELHWCVTVQLDGEDVITISDNHLSGRDLSEHDEKAIELAGRNLLGFIGRDAASILDGEGITPCTCSEPSEEGTIAVDAACPQHGDGTPYAAEKRRYWSTLRSPAGGDQETER